jgi:Neuraminidase (sialidase)
MPKPVIARTNGRIVTPLVTPLVTITVLAVFIVSAPLTACNKRGAVYSGRYLAERSDDGGKTWFNDEGGLAAKSGSTREAEEGHYSNRVFEAAQTLCGQSNVDDISKVRVRGFTYVKEGKAQVSDEELRSKPRFDTDCQSYLAFRK